MNAGDFEPGAEVADGFGREPGVERGPEPAGPQHVGGSGPSLLPADPFGGFSTVPQLELAGYDRIRLQCGVRLGAVSGFSFGQDSS